MLCRIDTVHWSVYFPRKARTWTTSFTSYLTLTWRVRYIVNSGVGFLSTFETNSINYTGQLVWQGTYTKQNMPSWTWIYDNQPPLKVPLAVRSTFLMVCGWYCSVIDRCRLEAAIMASSSRGASSYSIPSWWTIPCWKRNEKIDRYVMQC